MIVYTHPVSKQDRKTPLTIGLTGGIASGKSTVAELFSKHAIQIIDADIIARQVVEPGSELLGKISDTFGRQLISQDGSLDRQQLRQIVFTDPDKRLQLEALLHPEIYARITGLIGKATSPYVVVMIPLLVETGRTAWLDRVLVIDAGDAARIERARVRNGLSAQAIRDIMATQVSREERLQAADDVIVNDGNRTQLVTEVTRLHEKYLQLAAGVICA